MADKLLDLRQCKFPGADFSSKVLSGGLMSDADFSNTKLVETVLTKVCSVNLALLPALPSASPCIAEAAILHTQSCAAGVCGWGRFLRCHMQIMYTTEQHGSEMTLQRAVMCRGQLPERCRRSWRLPPGQHEGSEISQHR